MEKTNYVLLSTGIAFLALQITALVALARGDALMTFLCLASAHTMAEIYRQEKADLKKKAKRTKAAAAERAARLEAMRQRNAQRRGE